MIQINELRMDNWVKLPGTAESIFSKVFSIQKDFHIGDEVLLNLVNGYNEEHIEPIILTPEILEKAGFQDDSYANFTKIMPDNPLSNSIQNPRWVRVSFKEYACLNLTDYIDVADFDISAPCKYVHQLQNLWFTLTGTELSIEL